MSRSTYEEARKAYDLLIDGFMAGGVNMGASDRLAEELQERTGWTPMQLAEEAHRQHTARLSSPTVTGTAGCRCHGGELRPRCVEECSVGRKLAMRAKGRTFPSGPFH